MPPAFLILIFLLPYLAATAFEHFLSWCNDRHQVRPETLPPVFRDTLDAMSLSRMRDYARDRNRFSILHRITTDVVLVSALMTGLLQALDLRLHGLHPVIAGLLFFGFIGLASFLIGLPFDWSHAFIIEKRHGFSTKTPLTWILDQVKGLTLSLLLGTALLSGILAIWFWAGSLNWFFAFLLVMGFQLLMIFAYPLWVAPLFNTFTPLAEGPLRQSILELCQRTGLDVKDILVMDASRRTAHTNAYMAGLGRSRRIVFYDSLLQKHPQEEIIAILAHEIGHWKFRHLPKQIFFFGSAAFLLFWLAGKLMDWPLLYTAFGFAYPQAHTGFFLLALLWTPAGLLLSPLSCALSRRAEYKADAFAKKACGSGKALQSALKRMAKDNLSNVSPHPLYVLFHYTHPPLAERIAALEDRG